MKNNPIKRYSRHYSNLFTKDMEKLSKKMWRLDYLSTFARLNKEYHSMTDNDDKLKKKQYDFSSEDYPK